MGKILIIKGADFSQNSIEQIDYGVYIPEVVKSEEKSISFLTNTGGASSGTWSFYDDVNELGGKTISGFDIVFQNRANNLPLSTDITFGNSIICEITCTFTDQDEFEKVIHYDLPTPYTFIENDTIIVKVYGNKFIYDGSSNRRGCVMYRIDRPDNVPNFSFKVGSDSLELPQYSLQPFSKLYLI